MSAEIYTQSRLQDYTDCAYRYLLRYIKKLDNPTMIAGSLDDYEIAVERGTKFHRLAEQYLSGIPQKALLASVSDPLIGQWWARLTAEALTGLPARRYPEFTLVAPLDDVLLSAKIDLLAVADDRIVIVDWKTSRRPKNTALESRIQTKVYRWVVAQAAERAFGVTVAPEQIEMRYWFAADPSPLLSVSYSQQEMARDEADIRRMIQQIQAEQAFLRTTDRDRCRYCAYRSICYPEIPPAAHLPEDETDEALLVGQGDAEGL